MTHKAKLQNIGGLGNSHILIDQTQRTSSSAHGWADGKAISVDFPIFSNTQDQARGHPVNNSHNAVKGHVVQKVLTSQLPSFPQQRESQQGEGDVFVALLPY